MENRDDNNSGEPVADDNERLRGIIGRMTANMTPGPDRDWLRSLPDMPTYPSEPLQDPNTGEFIESEFEGYEEYCRTGRFPWEKEPEAHTTPPAPVLPESKPDTFTVALPKGDPSRN